MPPVEVIRAADRFATATPGVESRHVFSFGAHYDPGRIADGPLRVVNEEVVAAGAGFEAHAHRDVEIVTWVVAGALEHEDSAGHRGVVRPGVVQRLSAGSGVTHEERNADREPGGEPVRFVQMWLDADADADREPAYAEAAVDGAALAAGWVTVASGGAGSGALVSLRTESAALLATRIDRGGAAELAGSPRLHVAVVAGMVAVAVDDEGPLELAAGDTALVRDASVVGFTGIEPAEVLVWLLS